MPTWRAATSGDDSATACVTAGFRSGNNAIGGPWEYNVTGQSGNTTAKQYAWGSSGGQLSGSASAQFNAAPGGGANSVTWSIGNGGSISYGSQTYGNVQKVGFYVAVDGLHTESIQWTSLTVTFYDANDTPSVLSVSDLPTATTADAASEFWVAVPDSGFTAVRVSVLGEVLLSANVGNPGQNALIGYIYLWADSCNAT